jgi:hypothetical protein
LVPVPSKLTNLMMTSFNCVVTGTLLHLDFYDFLRESVLVEIIVRMFPPEREGNSYFSRDFIWLLTREGSSRSHSTTSFSREREGVVLSQDKTVVFYVNGSLTYELNLSLCLVEKRQR